MKNEYKYIPKSDYERIQRCIGEALLSDATWTPMYETEDFYETPKQRYEDYLRDYQYEYTGNDVISEYYGPFTALHIEQTT